jgi:hypothetical protein
MAPTNYNFRNTIMGSTNSSITGSGSGNTIISSGTVNINNASYASIICGYVTGSYSFNNSISSTCVVPDMRFTTATGVSDIRLKKNIEPIVASYELLDKVKKIKTYKFHFTHQNSYLPKNIGFVAQQMQELFPEMINDFNINQQPVTKKKTKENNYIWVIEDSNEVIDESLITKIDEDSGYFYQKSSSDRLGIYMDQLDVLAWSACNLLSNNIKIIDQRIDEISTIISNYKNKIK